MPSVVQAAPDFSQLRVRSSEVLTAVFKSLPPGPIYNRVSRARNERESNFLGHTAIALVQAPSAGDDLILAFLEQVLHEKRAASTPPRPWKECSMAEQQADAAEDLIQLRAHGEIIAFPRWEQAALRHQAQIREAIRAGRFEYERHLRRAA